MKTIYVVAICASTVVGGQALFAQQLASPSDSQASAARQIPNANQPKSAKNQAGIDHRAAQPTADKWLAEMPSFPSSDFGITGPPSSNLSSGDVLALHGKAAVTVADFRQPAAGKPAASKSGKAARNDLAAIFKSMLTNDESKPGRPASAATADFPRDPSGLPRDQSAMASGSVENGALGQDSQVSLNQTLLRIGKATGIALVAAVMLALFLKRFGIAKPRQVNQSELRVIETYRVATKSHLKLVAIGKSRFLVAVNADGIKSIQAVQASFETVLSSFEENSQETAAEPAAPNRPSESVREVLAGLHPLSQPFPFSLTSRQTT